MVAVNIAELENTEAGKNVDWYVVLRFVWLGCLTVQYCIACHRLLCVLIYGARVEKFTK